MASSNITNTSVVYAPTRNGPYYNDLNEEKGFYQILPRPGLPVQARELIQMQSLAQIQTERFGRHVFAEGSLVQGGQISFASTKAINLASQYANSDIDVASFIGKKVIYSSGNTKVQAQVISGKNAEGSDPPTLMVKYLTGDEFSNDSVIMTSDETAYANVATANAFANGMTATVSDGVFFVQGYFVRSNSQIIVVDKYSDTPNTRVGFEIVESIITEDDDSSLLNPVQESSNYQGIGATRYKIELRLSTRTLDSTDDSKFVELLRLKEGKKDQVTNVPVYSELEETFARRTYDESGSYTVRPFNLQFKDSSNSSNIVVRIDPGKAYIYGYEFETVGPTDIEVPRARDTANVSNYDILTAYGNYLTVANLNGIFDISTMPTVDIHNVPYEYTVNANTDTYNSTKIGTTRVRNITYNDSYDDTDGSSFIHNLYVFDVRLSKLTGNATGGNTSTITMNNPTISSNNNAYNGAYIRLTAGPGSGDLKRISSYDGATKTATITGTFSAVPLANTQYSIEFAIKDAESIVQATAGSSYTANANIYIDSKDNGAASGNTYIRESDYNKLLFRVPNSFVSANTGLNNYQYRRVYTGRTFTAGVGTVTAGTGESLVGTGALSDSVKLANYIVVVTDNSGSANISVGEVLSFTASGRSISVAGSTATLDSNLPDDTFVGTVITNINIDSGQETEPKSKTLVSANTTHFVGGSSNGSFISGSSNTTLYLLNGQALINTPVTIVGTLNSVYTSDVKEIKKVYDLNGSSHSDGLDLSAFSDVSSRFEMDTGQRDAFYDHGGIKLKAGYSAPRGPLVVCFDYYSHGSGLSDGKGYFSVDSYPSPASTAGYSAIPTYTATDGTKYRLSDCVDFRPVRQNASNTSPGYTLSGIRVPTPNENFTLHYDYYLPRRDFLVLNKKKEFQYVTGISGPNPQRPKQPDNSMSLYKLDLQPFTASAANVRVLYQNHQRSTMDDINNMKTRLENLEYYTALSIMEKATLDLSIRDSDGLERTKHGIVADNFNGHGYGDVSNPDYRCSIDFKNNVMRPPANKVHNKMYIITGSGYSKNGTSLSISYSSDALVTQNLASKVENVQPYNIARFKGKTYLDPTGDTWVDTNRSPDVIINTQGQNDAYVANNLSWTTEWGDWETRVVGYETVTEAIAETQRVFTGGDNSGDYIDYYGTKEITTVVEITELVRTGVQSAIPATTTSTPQIVGDDKVVDVSIIPYIRPSHFNFKTTGMRPARRVWHYFDGVNVTSLVRKPNKLVIDSTSTQFNDLFSTSETITAGSNSANVVAMSKDIRGDSNNILYIYSDSGEFGVGETITGSASANTGTVKAYYHYSGNASAALGNTSNIKLATGASAVDDYYVGNTIYIVTGTGFNSNAVISSYNAATRIASLTTSLSEAPTTNSVYSIGEHYVDDRGIISGTMFIPERSASYEFRNGQKLFRIIDEVNNDTDNATTRSEVLYYATGLIQTKSGLVTSTNEPDIVELNITDTKTERKVISTTENFNVYYSESGNIDPLAQTFFVPKNFPDGLFLDSVDLCFRSKDSEAPVRIEIRPTVNGFPHESIALPFSSVEVFPEYVNISDAPNLSDSSTYTRFKFKNPVYLEPGKQYALVVLTDSLSYETYVAELGKPIIGSDRLISNQPYIGSLFKSQNASTWTPFQFEDLMFRLNRCVFGTSATVYFNHELPTANVPMDWMYVDVNSLVVSNTSLDLEFQAMSDAGVVDSAFTSFSPNKNYKHNARKIIDSGYPSSLNVKMTMTSSYDAISPIIDTERVSAIAIENIINNASLSNTNIVFDSFGSGYDNVANISMTITGGGATTTANVYPTSVANGSITGFIVDSNGAGYVSDASITIVDAGDGTGANAIISSETSSSGGPAKARYITRKVQLKEGFDAGDLRVYVTAYKPLGTEIYAYYKVKATDDSDTFESKEYVKMVQATPTNVVSVKDGELKEYEYRPSVTSNTIVYTANTGTYDTFSTFTVKLVLASENTITVPYVKDVRAIALPGAE